MSESENMLQEDYTSENDKKLESMGIPRSLREPKAKKKFAISGSTLKIIAIITMLIDHIGATILAGMMQARGLNELLAGTDGDALLKFISENQTLYSAYTLSRLIGRIAFPIFCFLLVEGFLHTRNVKKYALRLAIFALISEVPFDLALNHKVLEFQYQNVFFTLLIGLLVLMGLRFVQENKTLSKPIRVIMSLVTVIAGLALANFLRTDYSSIGVACILLLYVFRYSKPMQIIAGCLAFLWEISAPLAFVPIGFYNGERGVNIKYLFYAFYPVHLLILYFICVLMKLA